MTTFSLYTATHAEGSLCVSLCGVTHSFEQHHISCISSFVLRRTLLTPLPVKQQNVSPQEIHPYAVDVSSGIETNGFKDKEKMRTFVTVVRKKS